MGLQEHTLFDSSCDSKRGLDAQGAGGSPNISKSFISNLACMDCAAKRAY